MPAKPPIVLLSNIRWNFLWQWSQILATMFAEAGYPTVCVETTGVTNPRPDITTGRKVLERLLSRRRGEETRANLPDNLNVYAPFVAPPTYKVFRYFNRRVLVPRVVRDLRRLVGMEPVFIAFPPTQTTLDIISGFRPRLIWYHCVLNYEHYPRIPADTKDTERRLLELSDLVTVDANFLKEKHRGVRLDVVQIESGVDFGLFQEAYTGLSVEPVRTVCFFGSMDERRFDFDLVQELSRAGLAIRLLGTLSHPTLSRVPGVEYRGEVPHRNLPSHLRDVDALIIPYKINTFSKGTFPAKTYECLATGKPVVATPLPDLLMFGEHIYLAASAEEFVRVLRRLPELETLEKIRARVELARENSWEARFEKFEELLWQKI
jgi:glycosyltransferase involved in cell wall biosynthesis